MKSMIEQFHDFAASKPANEPYNYENPNKCAIGQFLTQGDFDYAKGTLGHTNYWRREANTIAHFPEAMNEAARKKPWTFGALADRLRARLSPSEDK